MSCRNSRYSSAMITFARGLTGLEDNQVLALSHALMQEGHQMVSSEGTWNAAIDSAITRYNNGEYTLAARSRDPIARLEAARAETPEGPRQYAGQRLIPRALRAVEAQEAYLTDYARDSGSTYEQAQRAFQGAFNDATDDASLRVSADFQRQWDANPDNASLFVDRRSLYAYSILEDHRNTVLANSPSAGNPIRRFAVNSSAIAEVGYDEATGRAEIVLNSNPDRAYNYQLTQSEWADFVSADSMGAFYARNIRHNAGMQYTDSREENNVSGGPRQCATCGQFRAVGFHACPVPGSPASRQEDLGNALLAIAAQQQATAALNGTLPPLDEDEDILEVEISAPESQSDIYILPRIRSTRYASEEGLIAMPSYSHIRSQLRDRDAVQFAVLANFEDNQYTVSGYMIARRNPTTGRYEAEALTEDIGRRLQCYCEDYRTNYQCAHTRGTVAQAQTVLDNLNTSRRSRAAAVTNAATAAQATVTASHDASLDATQAALARFTPIETSLVENPEEFQSLYEEFRNKRSAYTSGESSEYPVPYYTQNAFGGLGTRESGRGVGIEIEYSFPSDYTYSEVQDANYQIGQELYQLGLTRSEHQGGYGASHGWVRDTHERGWSFESDGTTGGRDAQAGGEIVSPVMYDEPETWENLAKITEVIKRHGAVPSQGAGMHVHVSSGDYNHRLENHNRLLNALASNEDLIYRLSSNPERGRHRGTSYCSPNNVPSSAYTDVGSIRRQQSGHYIGINFQSVNGRNGDHVEIRTFDSTLEPGVMQAQMAAALFMTEGALRPNTASTIPDEGRTRLGHRLNANPTRGALTGAAWTESTLSMRSFIDKFVPGNGQANNENPQVRQLVSLFAMTKWQGRRTPENQLSNLAQPSTSDPEPDIN